jgi:transcriptional regulator with XRE-family HTH domain
MGTEVKQQTPKQATHTHPMSNNKPTRESLARNIRYLMKRAEWSESELARRSGVSQKSINNILNLVHSPKLETVDAIAEAFGLTGWHLIMPNLPDDLLTSRTLEGLVRSYVKASDDGRELINRVAEREAAYASTPTPQPQPPGHKKVS